MMRVDPRHISREVGPDGIEHVYVSGGLAVRMFVIFALAYVLSYGFRAINAVIAQPLVVELGLSASQLGFLASAYFLSFAVMQLPVGVMLDRYGPRRVEAVLIGFAALGALFFALADSYLLLWLGRALIGVGVSACLMAAVKAYSMYFRPHLQASLSSWMLVAGSLGALTVTTPVEMALPVLGWRGVFGVAAVLCVLAGLALWFALPSLFKPQKTESVRDMAHGYGAIYRHPHFWRVAPLAMITQGGFMAFHGLWVGPWFTEVIGVSNAQAAQSMFWISATLMLGYLLLGFLTRWVSKAAGDEDQIMMIGMGLSLLVFALQIVQGSESSLWGWLLHALLISSGIMTYVTCNKPFPKKLTGRSSTALNLLIFIGAFSIQWGIGVGIDLFVAMGQTPVDAMRLSLAILWGLQCLTWVWYARPGRKASHLIPFKTT
jgi:predicted MFS family arabinose efflux permease